MARTRSRRRAAPSAAPAGPRTAGRRRARRRARAAGRTPAPAGPSGGAARSPMVSASSALRTGFGAVRLTGPTTSLVSRWTIAPTSSSSAIQLIHWRPDPKRPPRPTLNSGSILPQRPALRGQHDAGAQVHDPRAGALGRRRARLPRLGDLGEEPGAGRRALVELLVAAVAVEADRRARQQHAAARPRAAAIDSASSVVARVRDSSDLRLYSSRPALVADAGAGEVDDGVDAGERPRVEPPGVRVPADLAGRRRRAHDRHRLVAVGAQARHERGADQPVGTGDGDAHVGEGTRARAGSCPRSDRAGEPTGPVGTLRGGGRPWRRTPVTDGGSNWQPPEPGGAPPPPPPAPRRLRAADGRADTAPGAGPRRRRRPRPVEATPAPQRPARRARSSPPRSARWPSSAPASSPSPASPATARRPAAPARPRRRPTCFLDALDNEDVLGARRRAAARRARDVPPAAAGPRRELKRLEVLSDDDLSDVSGVDITITDRDVEVDATNVDDIVNLDGDGDRRVRRVKGEELPIGDWIRDADRRRGRLAELDETTEPEPRRSFPITAVAQGRPLVPQPLLHRRRAGPRRDATPTSRPRASRSNGGDSPEAAMDNVDRRAPPSLDLTAMIGALNPNEFEALQRYAPLFLDDAQDELDAASPTSDVSIEVSDTAYDVTGSAVDALASTSPRCRGRRSRAEGETLSAPSSRTAASSARCPARPRRSTPATLQQELGDELDLDDVVDDPQAVEDRHRRRPGGVRRLREPRLHRQGGRRGVVRQPDGDRAPTSCWRVMRGARPATRSRSSATRSPSSSRRSRTRSRRGSTSPSSTTSSCPATTSVGADDRCPTATTRRHDRAGRHGHGRPSDDASDRARRTSTRRATRARRGRRRRRASRTSSTAATSSRSTCRGASAHRVRRRRRRSGTATYYALPDDEFVARSRRGAVLPGARRGRRGRGYEFDEVGQPRVPRGPQPVPATTVEQRGLRRLHRLRLRLTAGPVGRSLRRRAHPHPAAARRRRAAWRSSSPASCSCCASPARTTRRGPWRSASRCASAT